MTGTKPQNCDGCSACCGSVGHPPFLLALDDGVISPVAGADSYADLDRLLAAPPEAQAAYVANHGVINSPCAWLDAIDNRCRYYDFRPDICRTFEIGGKWCSQFRELKQIDAKKKNPAALFRNRGGVVKIAEADEAATFSSSPGSEKFPLLLKAKL